jgi:hypothetical protein
MGRHHGEKVALCARIVVIQNASAAADILNSLSRLGVGHNRSIKMYRHLALSDFVRFISDVYRIMTSYAVRSNVKVARDRKNH